jgi:hypothetical protein
MFSISKISKVLAASGLLAATALGSTSTQAAVLTWDYTITSGFTSWQFETGPVVNNPGAPSISWGAGSPQSSLVIEDTVISGSLNTLIGGGMPNPPFIGDTTALIHNNNVISGDSNSLTSAQLSVSVVLTPTDPMGLPINEGPFQFQIAFNETTNTNTNAQCGFPSASNCDDIFVLLNGMLNQSFQYDAGDGDGLLTYFVNIFPTSGGVLSILPPASCAAAGQPEDCIGFQTRESQSTRLAFGFTISTERLTTDVPEPGMLALLGIGLAGLGAMRRRRA